MFGENNVIFAQAVKCRSTVKHHITISNVKAAGFMGFLYRNFGKSSIGNALLNSYKTFFEDKYK
jgi:hypothetical protein